jgi:hypothetical protein
MTDIDPAYPLPRRTTPTWEVELLISGVAVFAMLQLPGLLDDAVMALEPRLGIDLRQILLLSYIYAKSAAVILAMTFVIHLFLRARWIALVGMHSVHPDGIRLDALRLGPIQREVEHAIDTPIPERIERADNLATTVFAIGVMLAAMLVGIAFAATSIYATGAIVASLGNGDLSALTVMMALFAIVMAPFGLLVLFDRHLAARLPPDSRLRRIAKALFRGYARIGFSRTGNSIMALLASHGGDRRAILLTTGVMFVALAGSGASLAMLRKPELFGNYARFPRIDTGSIETAHYDDQRDPARDGATPYIQSSVIVGPYVKLVVPYRPRFDDPAMRRDCPHMEAKPDDVVAQARLACLQRIRGVTLDGKPLANLQYEVASDARTDRPALLAMIDVRDLPRGRHELRIARPLRADGDADDDKADPGYDRIAFWR